MGMTIKVLIYTLHFDSVFYYQTYFTDNHSSINKDFKILYKEGYCSIGFISTIDDDVIAVIVDNDDDVGCGGSMIAGNDDDNDDDGGGGGGRSV